MRVLLLLACASSACGSVRDNRDDIVITDGSASDAHPDAPMTRDAGADAAGGCAIVRELLSNGSFDRPPTGVDWTESPIALVVPDANAPSAPNLASFHGKPAILESIDLAVASDLTDLRVTFAVSAATNGSDTTDRLAVALVNEPGGTTLPIASVTSDATAGWQTRSLQVLAPSVSSTVRLRFDSVTDGGTTFFVDSVSLAGLACR